MKVAPPPREPISAEVTRRSQQAETPPARKKPWSKPGFRRIEDGVLLTESSPDPQTKEDNLYYIMS